MKLVCLFSILILSIILCVPLKNRSKCGVTSIYYPETGTRTPLISFTSSDLNNRCEFTVISNKNKNNFKVQGPIVHAGIISSNLDTENEWYLINQMKNESINSIRHSHMFYLCKQLHLDNSETNFYSNHNLTKRYETALLPKNIAINVISPKASEGIKKSSFIQVKDIFDESNNLLQKKEINNELINEDNFDSENKLPNDRVQENSLDLNSLQATIKKELGVEKISYNFDD